MSSLPNIPAIDNSLSLETRGLHANDRVSLLLNVEGTANIVGFATLCPDANRTEEGAVSRTLNGHQLAPRNVALRAFEMRADATDEAYPFTFTSVDDVPTTLSAITSGDVFAWDERAMMVPVPANESSSTPLEGAVPTFDDNAGAKVGDEPFDDSAYERIEVVVWLHQLDGPEVPLRDVDNQFKGSLVSRLRTSGFDYSLGFITVTFRRGEFASNEEFKAKALVRSRDGANTLIPDVNVETIDGNHRREGMQDGVAKDDPLLRWAKERPLRVIVVLRTDGKPLSPWEKVILARTANIGSTTVRADKGFDVVRSLVKYASTFRDR